MTASPTPDDAAWDAALDMTADQELPGIAAHWLVDGFDSELLREVASMSA